MLENQYLKEGYVVKECFNADDINEFEKTFISLQKLQLKKLNIKFNKKKQNNVQYLTNLFRNNINALKEVTYMARNSSIGHKLASNENILNISKRLLNIGNATQIISGPSFFINFPKKKILKYTWHSEQNWYPKRRNFLNVWVPIFDDRTKNNSMAIKISSHKKDWFYFSEYKGYEGDNDKNTLVQYEIPENFVDSYRTVIPKVKKNNALFFNGKVVHRSIDPKIHKVFFTIVFRIFDYSNDLTLSSNWADIPYNRKSLGIQNINVKRDK